MIDAEHVMVGVENSLLCIEHAEVLLLVQGELRGEQLGVALYE